jgi:hypothetical protein
MKKDEPKKTSTKNLDITCGQNTMTMTLTLTEMC